MKIIRVNKIHNEEILQNGTDERKYGNVFLEEENIIWDINSRED